MVEYEKDASQTHSENHLIQILNSSKDDVKIDNSNCTAENKVKYYYYYQSRNALNTSFIEFCNSFLRIFLISRKSQYYTKEDG